VIHWLRNITEIRQTIYRDEGQTLVEYSLVLMLVALVAISPLTQIGVWVWNWLQPIADAL
jgi:Flp pilus assembly pilin Flp